MGGALMTAVYVASEITGREPSVAAIPFRNRAIQRSMGLCGSKSSGRIAAPSNLHGGLRAAPNTEVSGVLIDLETPMTE